MAVTQISRIQIRRGRADNLPNALEEGEMALTTDTGELFIGAPTLGKIQHRSGQIYPYKNIRVLTEFDVVHTLSDHVVTHTPLQRITAATRSSSSSSAFEFAYTDLTLPTDGSGNSTTRQVILSPTGQPGDLRGRVPVSATFYRGATNTSVSLSAVTILHAAGSSTNSQLLIDLDEATNINTILNSDSFTVQFLNSDTVVEFPLSESDSFVMDYSMRSEVLVGNLNVRRTGTLNIVCDEFSVAVMDNGVDLNQDVSGGNYMRVIWSGHTEIRSGETWVVLTLTNASNFPVSITFAGGRWAHTAE